MPAIADIDWPGPDHSTLCAELARRHAQTNEKIVVEMLTRHLGQASCSTPQEAFARLQSLGLSLTKFIPPSPSGLEIILFHGPPPAIGETLDESRIVDRVEVQPIFQPQCQQE